jgi:hypothetical protein
MTINNNSIDRITLEDRLHNLYSLPNIIRGIKSTTMGWTRHVARIEETYNAYKRLLVKPEGKWLLGIPKEVNINVDLEE